MQAPSLTYCGKAKAARGSAKRSATMQAHHLLPVGRQKQQEDQQGGLHYASTITYFLWEGRGSKRISKEVCIMQAPSLTSCGKAEAAKRISKEVCTMQAPSLTACGKAKAARGSARRSAL